MGDQTATKTILRWIAVLPAAIGAYIGVQIVVGLASFFLPFSDAAKDAVSQIMNSIIGPYFFVFAGAKTAPRKRFIVSVALTTISAIAMASMITLLATHPNITSVSLRWLTLSCALSLVATILACVQFHHDEKRN